MKAVVIMYAVGFACVTLAGCGGMDNGGSGYVCQQGKCGGVHLSVKGVSSHNATVDHGRIVQYRVSITGEDIDGSIDETFPGDATEGVIDGIPAGTNRVVVIEAINGNGATIREGDADGVRIDGGAIADVAVVMEAVPIFTNIADGSIVDNTRLIIRVFSDPAQPTVVEDASSSTTKLLAHASNDSSEVLFDESTGLGVMAPTLLAPGDHVLTVRDLETGRSSSAAIRLTDGAKRKAAPFMSASRVVLTGIGNLGRSLFGRDGTLPVEITLAE